MTNKILLLAVLLLTACGPMRNVQRNQKEDSTTVDRSEIEKIVTEVLQESGKLSQTIIEYYPPVYVSETPAEPQAPIPESADSNPAPPVVLEPSVPATATPPAVKRIIKTEIETEKERTTTTDSTARNDIQANMRSELSDKVVEKPPSSVMAVKWIAIALIAVLLIIIVIKYRRR